MKYRHIFWAVILIAIGVLFMLNNFGVIEFSFLTLLSLWPLILILWGISILPIKDGIKVIALVGVLAFTVIFFQQISENSYWSHVPFKHWRYNDWRDNNNNNDEESDVENYEPQNLSVPFDSINKKGILSLDAAAGNFNIEGQTSDFLTFNKSGDIGNYSLTTDDEHGRRHIRLSLEKTGIRHSVEQNKVEIKLNTQPSWNLDFDIGAAEINMDLRDYKIDTANINAGASSIQVQLGDINPLSTLIFNAGASSIKVDIPKSSGCQITSESFMVSKEFDGFTKTENGIYRTDNFKSSPKKIYILVKTAVSKIEVNRY